MNPFDLLKNAQAIQEQMGAMQEQLAALTAVGQSGAGMVQVEVNGKFEVLAVSIAPEIVDPSDIVMLQDLVVSATNQAMSNIRDKIAAEISSMTGGMPLQGLFGAN